MKKYLICKFETACKTPTTMYYAVSEKYGIHWNPIFDNTVQVLTQEEANKKIKLFSGHKNVFIAEIDNEDLCHSRSITRMALSTENNFSDVMEVITEFNPIVSKTYSTNECIVFTVSDVNKKINGMTASQTILRKLKRKYPKCAVYSAGGNCLNFYYSQDNVKVYER